jgi:hypothetical protein
MSIPVEKVKIPTLRKEREGWGTLKFMGRVALEREERFLTPQTPFGMTSLLVE